MNAYCSLVKIRSKFKLVFRACICLTFVALSQPVHSQNSQNPLFYSLEKNGKIIHVFGVSHIGLETQYPIKKNILYAFENAGVFINESKVIFLNNQQVAEILKVEYTPKNGRTLQSIIEKKSCKENLQASHFYVNVDKLLTQINTRLTLEKIQLFSPSALVHQLYFMGGKDDVALTLTAKKTVRVESYLAEKAQGSGKKILSLDPEFWEALSDLSDAEYCDLIEGIVDVRSIENFDNIHSQSMSKLLASIDQNDSLKVIQYFFEISELNKKYAAVHKKWFYKRNHFMVSKVISISHAADTPIFIAIGAAHLGGMNGVVALLEKAGFHKMK